MSRQRRAHDPLIDTIEGSDEENAQEIIHSNLSQQQIEITAPTHDSDSLLGGYNGESIMDSGSLQFKKNNYPGSFGVSIEPDSMSSFSMSLDTLGHPPLPSHSKDTDHFSVSNSLPSLVMELDSPTHEPSYDGLSDLGHIENKELLDTSNTKGSAHKQTELEHEKCLPNGDFVLAEPDERTTLCQQVTFSESDIFASQPVTFGVEPKALGIVQSQTDVESADLSTNLDNENLFPQVIVPDTCSPSAPNKRKRDLTQEESKIDVRVVKKVNFSDSFPNEIEVVNPLNSSIEVIYDKKEQSLHDVESQDMHLYLSNTQSESFPSETSNGNQCNVERKPADQIEEDWLTSHDEATPDMHSNDHLSDITLSTREPDVSLPDIETPLTITPDESDSIFKKALNAAQPPSTTLPPKDSFDDSSESPQVVSDPVTPVQIPISRPPKTQTPASRFFNASQKETSLALSQPNSQVLAEDSGDEGHNQKVNGSTEETSNSHGHTSQNDTEEELFMDKNSIRNTNDLVNGNWNITKRIRKSIEFVKWINPITLDVVYSLSGGDDFVFKDSKLVEKILETPGMSSSEPSKDSRISNISSITASSGYLADKSSSTNPSFNSSEVVKLESTRRSMASVISISPPAKPLNLPPLFSVQKFEVGCQTESSDTSEDKPIKKKPIRGRGRPKITKTKLQQQQIIDEEPLSEVSEPIKREPSETDETTTLDIDPEIFKKLKGHSKPLSEEDEDILLEENSHLDNEQYEYVKRKVREVNICVGMLVFARYSSDKNFYSGIVERQDRDDRWLIRYSLDEELCSVREVYILPTEILPKGFMVFVRHATMDYYEPGVVKGHIFKEVLLHTVSLLKGKIVNVPHSHLELNETTVKPLLQARTSYRSIVSSPGCDVTWENIVMPTKRRAASSPRVSRSNKVDSNFDTSACTDDGYKEPRVRKTKAVRSNETETDTDSSLYSDVPCKNRKSRSSNSTNENRPQTLTTVAEIEPAPSHHKLNPEMNPVVKLNQLNKKPETPKKRGKKTLSAKTKKTRKVEIGPEEIYGPIPEEGSKIFDGYSIIITSTESNRDQDSVADPPFLDREYITEQFTKGGGVVLNTFDQVQMQLVQESNYWRSAKGKKKKHLLMKDIENLLTLSAEDSPTKVFCVSNMTCRTAKFIQSLTIGIPVLSCRWISSSCKQGSCLNWLDFLLPAGLSLLTGNMMEQRFKGVRSDIYDSVGKVADILKGEKVFLASSTNSGFKPLWIELLSTAEAQVFTMPEKGGNLHRLLDRNTSVVLADKTICKEELKRAELLKIPIVSSEWFMQSLYSGCKLEYTAHPKFKHDAESAENPS